MISQRVLTTALAGVLGALAAAAPTDAHAQVPTPHQFVSGLDLECYKTPGPALNINVALSHLNPVLVNLGLPPHQVVIRDLAQTCVPVRKNNVWPAPAARPFIQEVDFACYNIDTPPLANPVPLDLTHLNPVLANLPEHHVVLERAVQLCVPVAKNDRMPPPQVRAMIQYIDLECYEVDPEPHPPFGVVLGQLNPLLQGIPPHPMGLQSEPRQLCVPVRKNAQAIPPGIRDMIRWIDLEKFKAAQNVTIAPTNVILRHLNPLFVNLPWVPVVLEEASSLMVPVAKNGAIPPND
jgi:hypothetical protein